MLGRVRSRAHSGKIPLNRLRTPIPAPKPARGNRLSDAPPRAGSEPNGRDSFFAFRQLVAPEDLSVVFQPIVDMRDGSLFAHEALVRCSIPELASPTVLFERAVTAGCVGRLGRMIRDIAVPLSNGRAVFINVHPQELQEGWLVRPDDPIYSHDAEVFLEVTESVPLTHYALCLSVLREVPFGLYYGGVDTTCLFVALAGAYARRTGDLDLIRALWPNLVAATEWMRDYGDSNGDGLIDYQRAAETGLSNQGWKDSEDSIFHRDGRFPKGPVALLEVQGYAYAAWQAMAEMGHQLTDGRAGVWTLRAEEMRQRVEDRFWMEDEQFYAIALDGDGNPCEAIGSNAGHLLFTGLPSPARAGAVSRRLLGAEFRSGWGLRTLARGQARFNPMSYHNGSVWPHDTSLGVAGMARYGERDAVAMILGEIYAAASHFQMRLPELFCGFDQGDATAPVPYPVACSPQAWAAGSSFLFLETMLGLRAHADRGELELLHPHLPDWLGKVTLTDLRVGDASVDLLFHRWRGTTSAEVLRKVGDLAVTVRL